MDTQPPVTPHASGQVRVIRVGGAVGENGQRSDEVFTGGVDEMGGGGGGVEEGQRTVRMVFTEFLLLLQVDIIMLMRYCVDMLMRSGRYFNETR